MQNDLSIQSVEHVAPGVKEMDLSRAFQRLSSRYKINTKESATQDTKTKNINLRDVFDRLSNLSQQAEKNNLERAKVAAELRDHARHLKEAMEKVQHDSQKVYLAENGLDNVLQVLRDIQAKIRQVTQVAVRRDNQQLEQLKSEASGLFNQLANLPGMARFDGEQLIGEGSQFTVSVGIDTAVTSDLELSTILSETQDIDISQANSLEEFADINQRVDNSIEHIEGKIGRLKAIHRRLDGYASNISTADDTLKAFGHQLRHISEAKDMSQSVGVEIRKGNGGLSFLR